MVLPQEPSSHPSARRGYQLACGLWVLLLLVVTVLVALEPDRRTVTPIYMQASQNWWAGRNLYESGIHGYLYPPQFAILYTPFARAPYPLGDVLWRWLNLGLFISGIARVARVARIEGGPPLFALISLLSIPASLSSARNGQVNMTEAGLMIHATMELVRARWWRATLLLSLGAALKPVPLAMALLAATVWTPMLPRLALTAIAVVTMPFAAGSPGYVLRQYQELLSKWSVSLAPRTAVFCDVNGLLTRIGIVLPERSLLAISGCAALVMLGLCLAACRRWRLQDRVRNSVWSEQRCTFLVLGLGAIHATVFNPRTETNGYVILAPAVAVFAAHAWQAQGQRAIFWLLVAIALGLGADNYPFHRQTDIWLKPLLGLCFLAYLVERVVLGECAPTRGSAPTE